MLPLSVQMNSSQSNTSTAIEVLIFRKLEDRYFETAIPALVYTLILLIIGLPGNICVLYVYYFRWRKNNTRYFVFAMAMFDIINCSVSLPTEIYFLFNMLRFDHDFLCKAIRFTTFAMNGSSALVLLTIAIDRYMRICKPFSRHMGTKTAFRMCLVSLALGILFDSPALYIYGTQTTRIGKSNTPVIKTCLEDDGVDKKHASYFIISITVFFVVIASTITVLYSCIGSQIWKRRRLPTETYNAESLYSLTRNCRSRSSSFNNGSSFVSGNNRKSRQSVAVDGSRRWARHTPKVGRSTFCLFIITIVYILSFLPFLILAGLRGANENFINKLSKTGLTLYQLFLRSYQLNSAINPLIYSFCNAQFRKHVYLILNKIFRRS